MTGEGSSNAGALSSGINTLIGANMRVVGDITCKGVLRVHGTILGNVHCDKNRGDVLVVDSPGAVTGDVHADNVSVRGRILGPIKSAQLIEVHEGGTITGDVSFRSLAIHAGGVVEGLLTPVSLTDQEEDCANVPLPKTHVTGGTASIKRFRSGGQAIAATALVIVAVAGTWIARDTERDLPADIAALPPVVPAAAPQEVPLLREDGRQPGNNAEPAGLAENDQGTVVTVRGANPSRPKGVFLLISKEAAILHRKKHDDPGEGTQTGIAQGEKISVAIAPDEVIRISKGWDVTIYFQGQKVPQKAIESKSWIKFVPR